MPVISATTFNQVAQFIAIHLNSEEIRNALLPENNIYAAYVADASKPKEKKQPKSKKTTDGIVDAVLDAVSADGGPKKRGGRKPKVAVAVEDSADVPTEVVAKKRGGRKPKVAAAPAEVAVESEDVAVEPAAEVVAKKKGGRKPKVDAAAEVASLTIEIPEISDMVEEPRRQTPRLEDDEEVEIEVEPLTYNGVDYLYDEKSNTVYDMESNVVGRMVNDELELA